MHQHQKTTTIALWIFNCLLFIVVKPSFMGIDPVTVNFLQILTFIGVVAGLSLQSILLMCGASAISILNIIVMFPSIYTEGFSIWLSYIGVMRLVTLISTVYSLKLISDETRKTVKLRDIELGIESNNETRIEPQNPTAPPQVQPISVYPVIDFNTKE